MAQAQVIATVSSVSGEAYARNNAGGMRRIKAGDAIREGETVVAADGAQVVLKLADGREMTVKPGETARLDAEVGAPVKPDAADSAVTNNQKGFQKIAQALTSGSDLDALLEDPAAGGAAPGGNEGHTFIEFVRVVESVDPLSYQFGTNLARPLAAIGGGVILNSSGNEVTIGVDAPDNSNDTTPLISGVSSAPAGSMVTVVLTDSSGVSQTLTTTVQTGGVYSVAPPLPLAPGNYSATASITGPNGNTVTSTDVGSVMPPPTIGSVVPGAPAIADDNVNEGQTLVFNVSINGTSTGPTSYALTLGGTATGGADYNDVLTNASFSNGVTYNSVTGQITVPAGVTGFTVSIPTFTDTVSSEPVETVALTIGGQTGTGGIVDITAAPSLAVNNVNVTEGSDNYAVFNVSISNIRAVPTLVGLALVGVTAQGGGVDFGSAGSDNIQVSTDNGVTWTNASSVSIPAGSTSVLVRTPVINDTLDENGETFSLVATTTGGVTSNASATGTGNIVDNDPTPSITINDVTVNEATGAVTFTVSLSALSGLPVSVNFATANGTAVAGGDFVTNSGTLTIPAGQLTGTITVQLLNDTVFEATESFNLNLSGATNATIADSQGVATILDNDKVLAGGSASGTEDTPLVLSWANFGVTNEQVADTGLSIKITGLPADGALQYFDGTSWVAVLANSTITYADINAGNLRFMPDANESGFNGFNSAGTGNLKNDYASVQFSVLHNGSVVSDPSTLTVDINPVADTPTLSPLSNIYVLNAGSTVITTGATDAVFGVGSSSTYEMGAGVTQANLEAELGVAAGYLDNRFDPTGPNINDPGFVDVIDGKITEMHYSLKAGTAVSWNYSFTNGEDLNSEVSGGFNDIVVLVVTDPLGNKSSYLVDSSEAKFPSLSFTGSYSFNAALDGAYSFQWLVLNSGDAYKDSWLSITTPSFVVPGVAGSYGAPIDLSSISAGLVDKDGSETLSVTISGISAGAIFDSGVKNADGSWTFSEADMAHLHLLPGAGYTGTMNLVVTATATETATGTTASTTQNMSIEISATTSTYTSSTELAQTLTGTIANDLMRGYAGNDTISGGDGNDMVYGGAGNDTISGGNGNDWLYGGVGSDTINGGAGNDMLQGGTGNDILTGSTGADTFRWELADRGTTTTPASDTITDFDLTANSDKLDLRDLLLGELHAGTDTGNLGSFLHFELSGANTIVKVSTTGGFASGYNAGAVDQQITLNGVNLTAIGTDQQIIQNLLTNGKLIAD